MSAIVPFRDNMLIAVAFLLFLSSAGVSASPHKKIAAFYNGDCGSIVPNPCQVCVDIKGGGFICECLQGWILAPNGHDCLKDPSWKPSTDQELLPQPPLPRQDNHNNIQQQHQQQPSPSQHQDGQGEAVSNLSGPQEQVVEGGVRGDGEEEGRHAVRLGSSHLPPDPVELGGDGEVIVHHSLDMKAGLDPPQSMYQLREGGGNYRQDKDNTRLVLNNNVWPDHPHPDPQPHPYPYASSDNHHKIPLPQFPPFKGYADDVVEPPVLDNNKNNQDVVASPHFFDNDGGYDDGDGDDYENAGDESGERSSVRGAGDGLLSSSAACEGLECQHNGSCVVEEGYARCDCPLGYTGSYCERELEVRFPRFRGTGFLALPVLRDGYKEFAVAIEFRPEAKNGLLLFSSEFEDARKDFFAITLNNGFVEFRFDCGTGSALLVSPVAVKMRQWNQLIVARNENRGSMQLNGAPVIQGMAQGDFTRITLRQNLYIGGYSRMTSIAERVNTSKTYVGCVQHLIINGYRYDFRKGGLVGDSEFGINVGECSEGLCERVSCLNGGTCHTKTADTHVCLCPLGFHGDQCEKETPVRIPRFNGHSHLEFAGLGRSVLAFTQLEVVVKPEAREGLLLYNGYTQDRKGDFIALALREGYVEFTFDLGTGPALIRSDVPLKLHHWHVIRASRTGLEGVLRVDERPEVKGQSQGAFTQLTLLQNLYLGGHQNFDHTSKHLNITSAFVGCIQKMVVNKRPLSLLSDNMGGRNIEPCPHPCEGEPCMNGGQCSAQGGVYHCSCPLGYTNTNCEDEWDRAPTKPMFSGNSYLTYTHKDIVKRVSGNKMDLQLWLKPRGKSGLVLWSGQEVLGDRPQEGQQGGQPTSFDYVALGFVDGSLQLRFNLGSGEAFIAYNDTRLFDGEWHFVRVQRDNQDAYMEVDLRQIVEGSAPGSYTMLNTNRIVYLGGMPDVSRATGGMYTTNYQGCVKDVLLATDFRLKPLKHAHTGRNILQCRKTL